MFQFVSFFLFFMKKRIGNFAPSSKNNIFARIKNRMKRGLG